MSAAALPEVVLAIREYENSVDAPEAERATCIDANGVVHLTRGDKGFAELAAYAEKCAEYLRFGREVDAALHAGPARGGQLKICDTPEILTRAGFQQKPMLYTRRHLLDALKPKDGRDPHRHGLSPAQIKRLPELMEAPVMLCDSPARADVLLMVLNAVDSDRLPLIAAVKPDGRGHYELEEIETNFVLAVYGKEGFGRYFEQVVTPERTSYFDAEKGRELSALAELQLFRSHAEELDPNKIIRPPQCVVKTNMTKNIINKRKGGRPTLDDEARDARAASAGLAGGRPAPPAKGRAEETR